MALQQRGQHLAEAARGQFHVALLDAVVDALHEPRAALRIGLQRGDAALGQRRVVQAAVIGALRGQHDGLLRAAGLQVQGGLARDVQHMQLRKQRLQLPMPGMGRVAGQGHAAHAQRRHAAHALQQVLGRPRGRLRVRAQRRAAVGHGQLHQPVFGIGLVMHGQALLLQVRRAGLDEQAHEIRACGRAHAPENAHRARGLKLLLHAAIRNQKAGLSLRSCRFFCNCSLIGRPRATFLGAMGCMNHLS